MQERIIRRARRRQITLRICAALLFVSLLLPTVGITASAAGPVYPAGAQEATVYLDGVEILDGECILYDSVTYVPLRNFCKIFDDCQFSWNGSTSTATVTSSTLTMTVRQNSAYITANGHYYYTVGKVLNLGGHMYVPIRPLARSFNTEVSWNATGRYVELSTENRKTKTVAQANYDADSVYWLSRIISAEAGGEPFLGQIAVGNVVMNRVASKSYPNTIYGVIFDRKHGTQFSPVSFGTIYNTPTQSSIIAAKICLEGYTLSDSILFFMNPRLATTNWISKNRPYAFTIGNHDFYD